MGIACVSSAFLQFRTALRCTATNLLSAQNACGILLITRDRSRLSLSSTTDLKLPPMATKTPPDVPYCPVSPRPGCGVRVFSAPALLPCDSHFELLRLFFWCGLGFAIKISSFQPFHFFPAHTSSCIQSMSSGSSGCELSKGTSPIPSFLTTLMMFDFSLYCWSHLSSFCMLYFFPLESCPPLPPGMACVVQS